MKTPYTLVQRFEQAVALSPIAASVALAFSPLPAHALTDIAASPLATTSSEVVLPNVMFILDNSGSMDWDFMPDYVSTGLDPVNSNCRPTSSGTTLETCRYGDPPFNSPDFNGIYYNPDIRYVPAIDYDKTSRTSHNNSTLWQAVPNDAYGIQDTGSTDILNAYPNTVWCNTGSPNTLDLMPPFSNTSNCRLPVQGGVFTYPTSGHNNRRSVSNASYAPNSPHYYKITGGVTWCGTRGNTNGQPFGSSSCQTKRTTTGGSPFKYPKYGAGGNNGFTRVDIVPEEKTYATLTIQTTSQAYCGEGLSDNCGCGSPSGGTFRNIRQIVTGVTHNNVVMRGSNVVSIGTYGTPSVTSNTVLLGACLDDLDPALPALISPNPTVTMSSTGATTAALSYPKTAARTDCAGAIGATGCSYTEEMTNFANWYAYYHTRMQMMKTAGGLAFKDISDKYRVGFITITTSDPVSSSRFLANSEFTAGAAGQRKSWYDMFYAQNPSGSTPLREALSRVGRYYAGLGVTDTSAGSGINNGMNHDPVQFSCQQNFAILSTDGFWNTGNETVGPVQLDGTTAIGNQDNKLNTSAPRPMFDGTTSTVLTTTTETSTQFICGEGLADTCGCSGSGTRRRVRETVDTVSAVTTFDPITGTSSTKTTPSGPVLNNVTNCTAVSNTTTNAPLKLQSPNPKVTVANTSSSVGGPENTLADVAQYYYITDLRGAGSIGGSVIIDGTPTTFDVGTDNNVPGQSSSDVQNDSATHQHMTTFTVSMGLDGQLTYSPDYKTQTSGDFASIKSGATNWPVPVAGTQTTVDDLWHAAVNGRGKYFSAKSPTSLATGMAEALSGVNAVVGAAAAAATSNLEPVAGDNFAYIASYETIKWTGEVEARTIDLDTGAVGTTPVWKASAQLDAVAFGSRKIWRRKATATDAGSGTDMQNFTYVNLDATTEQIYFKSPYIHDGVTSTPPLAQWTSLDPTTQQPNAQGTNLVNYLRGARTNEMSAASAVDRLFRSREHVLGDIVNAQPVYVKKSSLGYGDTGYDAFKNCLNNGAVLPATCTSLIGQEAARPATVFIAANDGMLHAFDGDTGAERWAYVPNQILPNMYKLANTDYGAGNNHTYFVDGSPAVGDVFDGTKWRTILVAGLSGGGRGFYALDVTKADAPVALWEFKVRDAASCPTDGSSGSVTLGTSTDDCDLGLSFGNPVITKLGDGTWAVMVTSGYRNVSPGDGKGYLYVLNPVTGVIRKKIAACNAAQSICPGDTATDAGLSKINNWVDDTNVNNTTLRVYGADLQGNVWRFDADAGTAFVLARLTDGAGTPVAQPVTTKPELGEVSGESMIYIATGKYLATADKNTTQTQTIYGIKDDSSGVVPTTPLDVRGGTFKAQTLTNTTDALGNQVRTVTANPVDVTAAGVDGWRVDLPTTGERVNVDMKLQLGTLIIGSNVPATNACTAGGFSFLNFLDYRTGSYISSSSGNIAGQKVGNALLVGINVVRLPNGKTVAIATTSDNQHPTLYPPFQTPNPIGRRVGWRELNE